MMKIEKESRVACQGPLRAQCLGSNQVDAMPPFQWLTFDSEMTIANVWWTVQLIAGGLYNTAH